MITALAVEIQPYIQRWPYVSNQAYEQPDGNAILYQGVFLAIKRRYYKSLESDALWVQSTYNESHTFPGVLNRGNHKFNDWQSFDDYIGMIYSSHITGELKSAIQIYNHGKNNFWIYDNQGGKRLKGFFGRIPGFIAMVKLSVRKKLNILDQISFALALIGNKSESGFQKSWLLYDLYKTNPHEYNLINWACKKFEKSVSEKYPNKMGDVFRIYYGPNHVFTKWMMGRI